jgi:hypothetical protein
MPRPRATNITCSSSRCAEDDEFHRPSTSFLTTIANDLSFAASITSQSPSNSPNRVLLAAAARVVADLRRSSIRQCNIGIATPSARIRLRPRCRQPQTALGAHDRPSHEPCSCRHYSSRPEVCPRRPSLKDGPSQCLAQCRCRQRRRPASEYASHQH